MRVVIGSWRESRQDFSSFVGISSRSQVESDDTRIAFLTSSDVAGDRVRRAGGGDIGARCGEALQRALGVKDEHSFEILFPKN